MAKICAQKRAARVQFVVARVHGEGLEQDDEQRQAHGELREEVVVGDGEGEMQAVHRERTLHAITSGPRPRDGPATAGGQRRRQQQCTRRACKRLQRSRRPGAARSANTAREVSYRDRQSITPARKMLTNPERQRGTVSCRGLGLVCGPFTPGSYPGVKGALRRTTPGQGAGHYFILSNRLLFEKMHPAVARWQTG